MRTILILIFLLVCFNMAFSQSNANFAYAQTTIKYDAYTRNITGTIPFDKPFKIEIDNIDTSGINYSKVQLYEVIYAAGKRTLKAPIGASTILPTDGVTKSKNTITLSVPGIKAGKNFDILILRKISPSTITRALNLNKSILIDHAGQSAALIYGSDDLKTAYNMLQDSVEDHRTGTQPRHISTDVNNIDTYYDNVFVPVATNYNNIKSMAPLDSATYSFDQTNFSVIVNHLDERNLFYAKLSLYQKMFDNGSFKDISKGLLSFDFKDPKKGAGEYDLELRIKNLSRNCGYIDSLLNMAARPLEAKYPGTFNPIVIKLQRLLPDMIAKQAYLQTQKDDIINVFKNHFPSQALWLNGTDDFTDLKVKGASIFTLDAGIMNIFTYDNYNKIVEIPKLFIGIDISLMPNDKTVDNKYLRKLPDDATQQHTLESQPSFWRSTSLTIGVTLGAMQNTQFDNVTNGLSFTIGPSWRLYKAFRFGFGAAMLRRSDPNPLLSDKTITPGVYAGISIDFDLLDPIKNATSMIFK